MPPSPRCSLAAALAAAPGAQDGWEKLAPSSRKAHVTAVESAMLDLLGQFMGVPVAALLGEGVMPGPHCGGA